MRVPAVLGERKVFQMAEVHPPSNQWSALRKIRSYHHEIRRQARLRELNEVGIAGADVDRMPPSQRAQ